MGKVILYIAQSLDGYIAKEDGSIDWLWSDTDEDYGYEAFLQTIDTIILGRKTYDHIFELTDEFPYKSKDVYVVSDHRQGHDHFATYLEPEQIVPFIQIMSKEQDRNIWVVGGAQLIHHFIGAGLIDEFQIAIQPTLIGRGIRLFLDNEHEEELMTKDVKHYPDGMLLVTYARRNTATEK
ncbi:UNVERIFIED_CONTAM: dihydrofolate reductase family protein [Halobacillus marinus]